MRKKLANNKLSVRINIDTPTPYIKNNLKLLVPSDCHKEMFPVYLKILDIGCGNGRNMKYLNKYASVCIGLDMNPTCPNSELFNIGKDQLPTTNIGWDLILVNYVFMFLSPKERKQLINQIKKVAGTDCKIVVELYPAKDSYISNDEEMIKMQNDLIRQLKWNILKGGKGKFIAQK